MIIEYLYKHYRSIILKYRLPVYILQVIFYFFSILYNEYNYSLDSADEKIFGVISPTTFAKLSSFINASLTIY